MFPPQDAFANVPTAVWVKGAEKQRFTLGADGGVTTSCALIQYSNAH